MKILSAAAITISAAGILTVAAPASAADCTHWKLDAGALVINQDNGVVVSVDWPANNNFPTRGSYTTSDGIWQGPATGGIVGGNKLDFTITFNGPRGSEVPFYKNHYTGTIEQVMEGFGTAKGTTVNDAGQSNSWAANEHFVCAELPPANAPANGSANGSANAPANAPADAPAAPQPVTDAIALTFKPSPTSIVATISNSSAKPGNCSYDATAPLLPDTHRDFQVGAKSSTQLKFDGLAIGANYHVVVNCADATASQQEPIGHVEQDVTF